MADDITVLDANDLPEIVRAREVAGGKKIQIFEHHTSASKLYLGLGNTGQIVSATKAAISGWQISNNSAGAMHVKLYDKATAPSAADDATLLKKILTVLPGQPFPFSEALISGVEFASGIGVRATALQTNGDTTSPGADTVTNIDYRSLT